MFKSSPPDFPCPSKLPSKLYALFPAFPSTTLSGRSFKISMMWFVMRCYFCVDYTHALHLLSAVWCDWWFYKSLWVDPAEQPLLYDLTQLNLVKLGDKLVLKEWHHANLISLGLAWHGMTYDMALTDPPSLIYFACDTHNPQHSHAHKHGRKILTHFLKILFYA